MENIPIGNKAYIGKSLSFCIKDILDGKKTTNEVACILTCTTFISTEEAYKHYGKQYWGDHSYHAIISLLDDLWDRIVQPRFWGISIHQYDGHWMEIPASYN
jgi:hypothetical protein